MDRDFVKMNMEVIECTDESYMEHFLMTTPRLIKDEKRVWVFTSEI
jgi:hypothetical protein